MFGCYLLEACCFLMRHRKGMDPEGKGGEEEVEGVEGEETVIRIYCMREEFVFNKKGEI